MDINAKTDALLVIDIQNDYTDKDGSVYVNNSEEVIPTINRIIESFEASGAIVIYTQDWHPEESSHFDKWPKHATKDSWGAELNDSLKVLEKAEFIKKGTVKDEDGYSAFGIKNLDSDKVSSTGLDELLKVNEIRRVFICGVATDYCIKHTAVDAAKAGYDTYVFENAIKGMDMEPGDEAAALREMSKNGAALVKVE